MTLVDEVIMEELLLEGEATPEEQERVTKIITGENGTQNPWDVTSLLLLLRADIKLHGHQ